MCTDRSAHPAAMAAAQEASTLGKNDSHRAGTDAVVTVDHCMTVALHSAVTSQEGVVQQLDAGQIIIICCIPRKVSPRPFLHPASGLPFRCNLQIGCQTRAVLPFACVLHGGCSADSPGLPHLQMSMGLSREHAAATAAMPPCSSSLQWANLPLWAHRYRLAPAVKVSFAPVAAVQASAAAWGCTPAPHVCLRLLSSIVVCAMGHEHGSSVQLC